MIGGIFMQKKKYKLIDYFGKPSTAEQFFIAPCVLFELKSFDVETKFIYEILLLFYGLIKLFGSRPFVPLPQLSGRILFAPSPQTLVP